MLTDTLVLKKLSVEATLKIVPVELDSAVIINLKVTSSCSGSVSEETTTFPSIGKL